MIDAAAKGWFKVPGIREDGDRALSDQMIGLEQALAYAQGRSVLDLGAAECAIALGFAKAGATDVLCVEALETHLEVGRELCKGYPQVRFVCAKLQDWIPQHPNPGDFDVVLALSIAHKLKEPELLLDFAAKVAGSLLVYRPPASEVRGWIHSKHWVGNRAHAPTIFEARGLKYMARIDGRHGEHVEYWGRSLGIR